MSKRKSRHSGRSSDAAYLRKLIWVRYRWPALAWFVVVLVFTIFRDHWTNATPGEITLMLFIACIWFVILSIIPLVNWLFSAVLSPSRVYEERPCYDIGLTHMHKGDYLAAKHEFLAILEDFPGDRFCYENLIEITAFHLQGTNDVDRLLRRARLEVPPSMIKELNELADSYQQKVMDLRNTEKKKLDVDFIYDSDIPESVFDPGD